MAKIHKIKCKVSEDEADEFIRFVDRHGIRHNTWYRTTQMGYIFYESLILNPDVAVLTKLRWGGR